MTTRATDSYGQRHYVQRAATDADQAEFDALKNGSTSVDAGTYDDRVAGTFVDRDVSDDVERWHRDDLQNDTATGRVQEEIERRANLLGPAYPFTVEDGKLTYAESTSGVYEFFLCICNTQFTKGDYVWLPRVFERIAARLVAAYFGSHAQSIHTGWPRDEAIGRSFSKAMATVSQRTGEWTWGPDEGLPDVHHCGDEGCDFVVWLGAVDARQIGQLFILGQCACGNDWQTKFGDLHVPRLKKWFNPLSVVDPVRSFATPHQVTDTLLREASRQSGLFFDRARLTEIASRAPQDVLDPGILQCIRKLIELVLG